MELRHLRSFLAVAEHLSFARAAEAIHISQPPLSRRIQELEDEIGSLLFIRRNNRIELTPAGEYLKTEAGRILGDIDEVMRNCREIGAGLLGPVRIGATSIFAESRIPGLLRILQRAFPEIRTELHIASSENQAAAIRAGSLDVGFVRHWAKVEGLVFEELGTDRLVLCFPESLRKGKDEKSLATALSESTMLTIDSSSSPAYAALVDSIAERIGVRGARRQLCSDAVTRLRLVREGIGWTVVAKSYLERPEWNDLGREELPDSISFGLLHRGGSLSMNLENFLALTREEFGRAPQPSHPSAS